MIYYMYTMNKICVTRPTFTLTFTGYAQDIYCKIMVSICIKYNYFSAKWNFITYDCVLKNKNYTKIKDIVFHKSWFLYHKQLRWIVIMGCIFQEPTDLEQTDAHDGRLIHNEKEQASLREAADRGTKFIAVIVILLFITLVVLLLTFAWSHKYIDSILLH